jgi:hypothetical protein
MVRAARDDGVVLIWMPMATNARDGLSSTRISLRTSVLSRAGTGGRSTDGYPSSEEARQPELTFIARKYNGEWLLADGPVAFNLDG